MTVGEGWNVDGPVNRELRLPAQLLLLHFLVFGVTLLIFKAISSELQLYNLSYPLLFA